MAKSKRILLPLAEPQVSLACFHCESAIHISNGFNRTSYRVSRDQRLGEDIVVASNA